MKAENKLIILSFIIGSFVCAGHAAIDLILLDSSIFDEPAIIHTGHELLVSMLIMTCFSAFGLVSSRLVSEQNYSEKKLAESLNFQQQLLDSLPVPVFYKDEDCIYKGCNKSFANFIGLDKQEILGKTVHDISTWELASVYHEKDLELINNPGVQRYEFEVNSASDEPNRQVIIYKSTFEKPSGKVGGIIGILLDITDRKKAENERGKLIVELREALSKVKLLSGFLPICASCKKIRDNRGCWQRIESYFHEHSEVEFTHDICPECVRKLYPDCLNRLDKDSYR